VRTLAEAAARVRALDVVRVATISDAPWVLAHCAQSIDLSMTRFPQHKSRLFQTTVGTIAKKRFLSKGAMSHDLTAPIPGAPPLTIADVDVGRTRLLDAIARFEEFGGTTARHFAYGDVTKAEYDALHAMHIANHLLSWPK